MCYLSVPVFPVVPGKNNIPIYGEYIYTEKGYIYFPLYRININREHREHREQCSKIKAFGVPGCVPKERMAGNMLGVKVMSETEKDARIITGIEKMEPFIYLKEKPIDEYYAGWMEGVREALKAIYKLPKVPKQEKGYWIHEKYKNGHNKVRLRRCSICGVSGLGESNYCPACGARMIKFKGGQK